jgi:hypothetical protein
MSLFKIQTEATVRFLLPCVKCILPPSFYTQIHVQSNVTDALTVQSAGTMSHFLYDTVYPPHPTRAAQD